MSGGFFRGTSADQDTRFSNKQAKLLKTQKFSPELDHLVDITKVKMDVMRPWIANRVTELLGFEDEVLINFIYGLLEGKVVDGKQIQIQLTGFMEKNTGKFMKELWNLLLSAQKTASGVPQQFLNSKEEEMRKKKAETDKLAQEIQKRKERGGWGPEIEKKVRVDDKAEVQEARDSSKTAKAHADPSVKHSAEDDLDIHEKDSPEADGRRTSRRKSRSSQSPHSAEDTQSSPRRTLLADRSPSRSLSNSRSYSGGSPKSRSLSISPRRQRRSVSRERQYLSPRRHLVSPRRPRSPLRRQSPYLRRRSISRSRHRSPSLPRRRSPIRRRSRSPVRRRSRSPFRYRSPSPWYRRSRSPSRRRSPVYSRRRSPSPLRHRSPVRRRPSLRHASPSPLRRASPRPLSPKRRRSPLPSPRRSYSPRKSQSPLHRSHRSPGKSIADLANRVGLKRARDGDDTISPARYHSEREETKKAGLGRKQDHVARTSTVSNLPQCDARDRQDIRNSVVVKSVHSEKAASPVNGWEKKSRHMRETSLPLSPVRPSRNQKVTAEVPETTRTRDREEGRLARERNSNKADDSRPRSRRPTRDSDSRLSRELSDGGSLSPDVRGRPHRIYEKNKGKSFSSPSPGHGQEITLPEEIEYGPGRVEDDIPSAGFSHEDWESTWGRASPHSGRKGHEGSPVKNSSIKDNSGFAGKSEIYKHDGYSHPRKSKKIERNDWDDAVDTDSEDDRKYKSHTIGRKMSKVDDKDASTDEAGYDSQQDDWKDRKRRRKDEKKLRKEEKRRRREERHRRKEERRASKQKTKYSDPGTPSDYEQNCDAANDSDDDARVDSKLNDNEETESEQKKLEIQLREKALESLRAKKAITN